MHRAMPRCKGVALGASSSTTHSSLVSGLGLHRLHFWLRVVGEGHKDESLQLLRLDVCGGGACQLKVNLVVHPCNHLLPCRDYFRGEFGALRQLLFHDPFLRSQICTLHNCCILGADTGEATVSLCRRGCCCCCCYTAAGNNEEQAGSFHWQDDVGGLAAAWGVHSQACWLSGACVTRELEFTAC